MPTCKPETSGAAGIRIVDVDRGSPFRRAGVRPGDTLLRANGLKVRDVIDVLYECGHDEVTFEVRKADGNVIALTVHGNRCTDIEVEPPTPKTCRNQCLFCFVSQMPRGLRRTLYVRDEDYRLSFLHGNYMTLSNLTEADRRRILEQRLSPLYVSVHSVNPDVRRRLLGKNAPPDIVSELRRLIDGGIRLHCQVVLCPDHNDRDDLDATIEALGGLYPGVQSLAVVPVGLTRFHLKGLRMVDRPLARQTVRQVERWQRNYRRKWGTGFVYASDEFYLRAGLNVPEAVAYDDYPQMENGVGLVRDFLDRAESLRLPRRLKRRRNLLMFTGTSFHPFLDQTVERVMERIQGFRGLVLAVRNRFFGETVTVAGLLTGQDVIEQASGIGGDALILPSVVLRDGHGVFLDDVTVADVERALGMPAIVVDPTPEGLVAGIREAAERPL